MTKKLQADARFSNIRPWATISVGIDNALKYSHPGQPRRLGLIQLLRCFSPDMIAKLILLSTLDSFGILNSADRNAPDETCFLERNEDLYNCIELYTSADSDQGHPNVEEQNAEIISSTFYSD